MNRINVLGQMDNTNDGTLESANRVYGADGISPTIPTCGGGVYNQKYWRFQDYRYALRLNRKLR